MTCLRMWKRDGVARPLSLADAVDWIWRNVWTDDGERPNRAKIEDELRLGMVLETPAALIGGDRLRMSARRSTLGKPNAPAERRRHSRVGGF